MNILMLLILIVTVPWIYGFLKANDFAIPTKSLSRFRKALFVFPHPDDETLSSGGLLTLLSDKRIHTRVVILTRGENGTDDAHLDVSLKETRKSELETAMRHLGITDFTIEDFGDGALRSKSKQLKAYLEKLILNTNPELVVTYDLSGLYGHDDHIVTSEILTDLIHTKYGQIRLWYPSFPEKILSMIALPEHMAKNPQYKLRRVTPSFKLLIGKNITRRIRALLAFGSQLYSFRKSFPFPWIPLWYYYSMQLYEYYYEAN